MKQLYDYQAKLVSDLRKGFRKNKRIIGQLPTGGGKGVILSEIARLSIAQGKVVCISCHRIEIFQQIFEHLRSFGIFPSIIAQGHYPMGGAQCYLSMVETVCRRMNKGLIEHLNIDFFILDEVHFGSYHKLVVELDCYVLGFTATPKSTGSPELKEYFDDLICGPKLSELIGLGRIVPVKTYSIDYDFNKVKMKGKEYDDRALFAEFKKPKLWEGAVNSYIKNARGLQALCYCVNIEHSNSTTLQFREHGINAAHVDGKTDIDTRNRIFDMYRDGSLDIICNVGIATTGTDLPNTRCIIQNFATTSLVKHVQTMGRGGRPDEGKEIFVGIDMGRNYVRHGEFGEDIDWVHIFEHPAAVISKESKRSKRECDECGAVIKFHLQQCPYCGDFISKKDIEDKLLFGATAEEVKAYRHKNMPIHLRKPLNQMSDGDLRDYSKYMGYSPKWYWKMKSVFKK